MPFSICVHFLQQFWYLAARKGLLDETDIDLLEEAFTIAENEESLLTRPINGILFLLAAIASILLPLVFGSFVGFFLLFILIIVYLLVLFLLPRAVCYVWSEWVDRRFHKFSAVLRQKELCLFSLQHSSHSNSQNSLPLPFQSIRKICLQQLRQFIWCFNQSSKCLTRSRDDTTEKLLINFIGDEMRALAVLPSIPYSSQAGTSITNTFDGEQMSKITMIEDEGNLHTSALKTLWQCMFLIRSEFVRISMLAMLNDASKLHFVQFIYDFAIFIYTCFHTSSLMIRTNTGWKKKQTRQHESKKQNVAAITPLTICKTRLEWTLERLIEFENSSTSHFWPPDEKLRRELVSGLLEIIKILNVDENEETEMDIDDVCNSQNVMNLATMALKSEGNDENADQNREIQEKTCDDYQIFEFDFANANVEVHKARDRTSDPSYKTATINSDSNILFSPYGTHNAVIHELRYALCERKENCLERELRALARQRGVPITNVTREELDRTPFSSSEQENKTKQKTEPALNQGHFGLGSLNAADLNSILVQRQKIMAKTANCGIENNFSKEEDCFCDDVDCEINGNTDTTQCDTNNNV